MLCVTVSQLIGWNKPPGPFSQRAAGKQRAGNICDQLWWFQHVWLQPVLGSPNATSCLFPLRFCIWYPTPDFLVLKWFLLSLGYLLRWQSTPWLLWCTPLHLNYPWILLTATHASQVPVISLPFFVSWVQSQMKVRPRNQMDRVGDTSQLEGRLGTKPRQASWCFTTLTCVWLGRYTEGTG